MLSKLTKTESMAASYEFTTLTCIPGVVEYNDAKIQLLDLPGIIEGAAKGKGRGRQVIGVGRTADVVLMVLNAEKAELQKQLLTKELESVGIRLNQRPADVSFKLKSGGGVKLNTTVDLTHLDFDLVRKLLQLYKIHNVDILFREDCTDTQLIDIIEGNRKYLRCLYCVNKIALIDVATMDRLAHQPDTVVCSIKQELNLDVVLEKIWEYLNFARVFTKPRGKKPEFSQPLIMRKGSTIEHVCHGIHRSFAERFKYALVWGTSAKHQPQRVGLAHVMQDEDV